MHAPSIWHDVSGCQALWPGGREGMRMRSCIYVTGWRVEHVGRK